MTWQKGSAPGEVRRRRSSTWTAVGYWGFFDPARAYLLSPEFLAASAGAAARVFGLPDGIFTTQDDLKKLPVATFLLGIGDRAQPSYNLDKARGNNRFHFYAQDGWKMTPSFTLELRAGWEHETNVLNYDLREACLPRADLRQRPERAEEGVQELHAGGGFCLVGGQGSSDRLPRRRGIFYDTQLGWWRLGERAVIGGSGRQFIGNNAVTNPLTGQPFSTAFLNSLAYNYGTFLAQLPALRAQQDAKYPGTGTQPQILLSKQANALGALYPRDFPTATAPTISTSVFSVS